jgi:hypothetical protein
MMGIMVPETCWDKYLRINIRLFASCWFSLHIAFAMHGHVTMHDHMSRCTVTCHDARSHVAMHCHMSRCTVTCHDARSHVTMHGYMNVNKRHFGVCEVETKWAIIKRKRQNCEICLYCTVRWNYKIVYLIQYYLGADKSLARPPRRLLIKFTCYSWKTAGFRLNE